MQESNVIARHKKCLQNAAFGQKITVIPLYQNDGYALKIYPDFNTNAPLLRLGGIY